MNMQIKKNSYATNAIHRAVSLRGLGKDWKKKHVQNVFQQYDIPTIK